MTAGVFSNEGLRSAMRFNFEEMGPASLDLEEEPIAPLNQTIRLFDHYVGSNDFELATADALTAVSVTLLILVLYLYWYCTYIGIVLILVLYLY